MVQIKNLAAPSALSGHRLEPPAIDDGGTPLGVFDVGLGDGEILSAHIQRGVAEHLL